MSAQAAIDALTALITSEIKNDGSISIARYMELCLGHPEHGYYHRRDPLGAGGDFTTAPEISQIFGEMIGLWAAQVWRDQGAPAHPLWVELGPGRGTLTADAFRAIARAAPDFSEAAEIMLVETSPALREKQKSRLDGLSPRFLERLDDAPDRPMLLIANEFFDALPIHQFRRGRLGWRERRVGLAPDDGSERFDFALSEPIALADHPAVGAAAAARAETLDLAMLETCPDGATVAAEIATRLARRGGAALIVDYGYGRDALEEAGGADTLQAVRAHAPADPLSAPGAADLTAHVDFDALAAAAGDADRIAQFGPIAQGSFLRRLGAEARATQLARAAPTQAETISVGLHRLTDPAEMGTLFKVMALTAHDAPTPPAFEPVEAARPSA